MLVPLLIILTLILSSTIYFYHKNQEVEAKEYEDNYEVVDVTSKFLIVKIDRVRICLSNNNYKLMPGNIIRAKIKVYPPSNASFFGDFDEHIYDLSKKIQARGSLLSYQIISFKPNLNYFKYATLKYLEDRLHVQSFTYVKALVFGINDLDKNVKDAYSLLYLSAILAISGMHIIFFSQMLKKLFQKIFLIEGSLCSTILMSIYVFFIGAPISALRALLFLILDYVNEKGAIKYTRLDILSISFIIMTFFNPYACYQNSFILSYLVSFILLFMQEFLSGKSKLKYQFESSLICIFTTLPFIINQTNKISLLGILISFLFLIVLGKFLLPLVLLVMFIPTPYYEVLFVELNNFFCFIASNSVVINLPSMNIYLIITYYFLFVLVLKSLIRKKRRITSFSFFIMFFYIILGIKLVNPYYQVTFIDVGQGDSILIELPNNQGKVLVDTYGKSVDYLLTKGINKLDYLVLTHFDNDHIGNLEVLNKEVSIKKILYSKYENPKKIAYLKLDMIAIGSGDYFQIGDLTFKILGPIEAFKESNANSIVMQFKIDNTTLLLTADMTALEEKTLINKYGSTLKSDILKVGHHGSASSSSDEFINLVKPNLSIISVGQNNRYGLPDDEVLKKLNNFSTTHLTSKCGNITLVFEKNLKVKCYRQETKHFLRGLFIP